MPVSEDAMSHIIDCHVTGLAGRDAPVFFEFDRHLNVFFGLNGTGKTSLLKILHSAMSLDAEILKNVPFLNATVTLYSIHHNETFKLSFTHDGLDKQEEIATREWRFDPDGQRRRVTVRKPKLAWRYEQGSKELQANKNWHHRYLPTTRLYLGQPGTIPSGLIFSHESEFSPSTINEDSLEQQFASSMRYLWNSYTSEVFAAVRASQETGLANILRDVLVAQDPTATQVDALDFQVARKRVENFLRRRGYKDLEVILANFDYKFREDPRLRRVVNDINTVEASIEQAVSPLTNLSSLLSKLYSGGKAVDATERGLNVLLSNNAKLDLNLLSSGEKHILRILVESLLANESTLIIDEPELSLHVDWQRPLVQHLRALNAHAQFILATHSPEIMADVPDKHVFRI